MRLRDAGESAVTVEFGDRIEEALAARVLALDAALRADPPGGLREAVPTYRSLLVHYDPLLLPRDVLVAHLERLAAGGADTGMAPGRHWVLPACHADDLAIDLPHVAATTGLTPAEVVALHAGARYRLVMYGFAPGWAYLSGLPAALTLPRRTSPRDMIPGGSLIVAGGQAMVAGGAMPSGWHVIGRTPVRMFDPRRDPPFLPAPGDTLAFDPVDRAAFDALEVRAAAGDPLIRAVA